MMQFQLDASMKVPWRTAEVRFTRYPAPKTPNESKLSHGLARLWILVEFKALSRFCCGLSSSDG